MGKLILCSGIQAKEPFYFKLTGTAVYSIEELCYYLYENIYTITEELFDEALVVWLNNQLNMEDISHKLSQMLINQNSLKDIVVSIMCSADYYTESEIKSLIKIIDEIEHKTPKDKLRIKADNYMKYCNYGKASMVYEELLYGEYSDKFTTEEYGDLLHNLAVSYIHIASFQEAATTFKEAYSRNHRMESLKQYFFALKLGKCDEEFNNEIENFNRDDLPNTIEAEYNNMWEESEKSKNYQMIERLSHKKADGRVSEYYQSIEQLISKWQQNYWNEVN